MGAYTLKIVCPQSVDSTEVDVQDTVLNIFTANYGDEDEIHPRITELTRSQRKSRVYKHYFRSVHNPKLKPDKKY